VRLLEESGRALDDFVSSLASTPEVLEKPVDDGGWRGADVLAHLLEGELVYGGRIGQVLTVVLDEVVDDAPHRLHAPLLVTAAPLPLRRRE
jgi:hypothetical protein